jgi:hypothetical protein
MPDNTPENAATSWRDLIDQLTREQVIDIQEAEDLYRSNAMWWDTGPRSEPDIAELLLNRARRYAQDNLGAAMIGDVPLPAGAISVRRMVRR